MHDRYRTMLSNRLSSRAGIRSKALLFAPCLVVAWFALAPRVAAAPLSNVAPVLAQLAAEAKDRSLKQEQRLQALEVLARWGNADVRGPLLELVNDPAPEIRSVAAKGLGWPGNAPAVTALRERVLDKAETAVVRTAAVGALVRIGDGSTRPMLLEVSRDPNPQVREQALRGLIDGPLQSPSDRLALATRGAEDGDLPLPFRAEAIRVLTSLKDPASVPVLVNILDKGPRLQIALPPANATQNEILQSRYLQIRDIRAWAARGLGELGDRSALPSLVKATEDTDDFFVRYLSAGALGSWRAREALPVFLRLLEDPSADTRLLAVRAIALVGDQSHVDAVAARLSDDALPVRIGASETLAEFGGPAALQRLEAARQNEIHPQVREAFEAALTRLKR